MSDTRKTTKPNVPNLRFPGFEGEWELHLLSDYCHKITRKNKGNILSNVLSNSANQGIISQSEYFDRAIANSNNTAGYYIIEQDDFVYNPRKSTAAPYGPVNVYHGGEPGIISPLYLCFKTTGINREFLFYYFKSKAWWPYMYENGDSGVRHDRVSIKDDVFFAMPIQLPPEEEQLKIAQLLSLIDQRIAVQNKVIEKYESLIKALRHHLFSTLEPVKEVSVADLLSYEQPTKYIVSDTEYSNNTDLTPVLTANKAFILGYTDEVEGIYDKGPCIILDDFTLDSKIVEFPFKVKSSAIKILSAKTTVSLRYIFEYLKFLDLNTEEHKRHYIAEIEPMSIELPEEDTIKSIAFLFDLMDKRRKGLEREQRLLKSQKDYLLREIFI